MRVVISIGGSILAPELDSDRVAAHAEAIESLAGEGCEIGIVVGGGGVARDYITTARELDANEVQLDQLGIDVTRINARLLISALDVQVNSAPATDYDGAGDALQRGDISVMGGITPGQTTDAVAAAFAEYIDADLLVYATNTDGVYDADPATDPEAIKYTTMSPSELVDIIVPMSRDAGASAPVDILAAKLIERSGMRSIVLDGSDPENIESAILRGDHTGTDIIPPGSNEPAHWVDSE
ncbi:uridylate kinase [Halohasta litchfieldiae]|jgi:uridylate kinase|uniref:Uridylate kinase n=1 Tax=Halohasta litchfieldiae TaxID=1073996 RepID=A0A1H6S1G0_9EURY|nr:UMP kinase [Halohasta litchfieldiae]ATW87940.1 uridylate kinase [Halohasta litchfieldiae]SEI61883.1 uridylate kinase [Halohasta litchfieldiae]